MNIQQFQYILALEETRHFEKAAAKCYISQSTLSTMISKFEEEIGINIFDRAKRPIAPTAEGLIIIEKIREIYYNIEQLSELTKELKGEKKGKIHLACIPTVAPFLLPLFLMHFSKKYPEIKIDIRELTTDEIIQQIKTHNIDIGILSPITLEEDIKEYPLYKEQFLLFDKDTEIKTSNNISSLNLDNFWLMQEGHCMRDQVLDICGKEEDFYNINQNIQLKASSIDSLIRFVKANKGKTLLPYLSTLDFTENDKKDLFYFTSSRPTRTISLVTHRHFVKKKILKLLEKEILNGISKTKYYPYLKALK